MSGTIEKARAVLAQLEQTTDVPRDETAAALRELIALAEGVFEDLDDCNTRIARAAKAIGATGCPVDQLNAVVRYTERVAPHFRYIAASGELIHRQRDENGLLSSEFVGPIEIRRNRDGSLDEVVAQNVFVHLEQMADNSCWMGVSTSDNAHLIHVNFYSDRAIEAEAEDQHAEEE
ncbi:MAG: hypothetical protein JO197_15440 [Acidobacteria bacterium]|nr:hypothetical protein [Acidobacteriota bacterium]MBV9475084.1 hypothetical protein [Acidobacteriota bacterium]